MFTAACESLAGGQGKSTVALLTARLLAQQNHTVLLVDADPQSSLTTFVGHKVKKNYPTLLEVLRGEVDVTDGIYATEFPNLFLIPSDGGLDSVQDFLSGSGCGAYLLRQQLEPIAKTFNFCVIDSPPQRSQLCLTTIGASNALILPMEATIKGYSSLVRTMELLEILRKTRVFSGDILGVLPFRDKWVGHNRTKQSRRTIEAMVELVGQKMMLPSIRESEQFKEAINQKLTPHELGYDDLEYPFEILIEKMTQLAKTKIEKAELVG